MESEIKQTQPVANIALEPFEVSAILNYLSACDITLASSADDLPIESCFGRGVLLSLIGAGVDQFVQSIEHAQSIAFRSEEIAQASKIRDDKLIELQGLYKQLIELPQGVDKEQLNSLKYTIAGLEKDLSLEVSDALADFKTAGIDGDN
jgi:hypothetical protein